MILEITIRIYHMAVSMLFLCNKTHKDPTLKVGCKKPYAFIRKTILFIRIKILHEPYFLIGMCGVLGKLTE